MPSKISVIVIMLNMLIVPAMGQTDSLQSSITQQQILKQKADSLKQAWSVLWKTSDSLRIEAMLLRMRSDSLRKAVSRISVVKQSSSDSTKLSDSVTISTSTEVIDSMIIALNAKSADTKMKSGKIKPGQTLSDSITFYTIMSDGDSGMASFYADEFHGKRTSSGQPYNMNALTCAHRWLPFGTLLKVINISNGNEVFVTVNDRGPFKHGRIIDVSKQAALELGFIDKGTAQVKIQVVR